MHATVLAPASRVLLNTSTFNGLLAALRQRGYTLIGPRAIGTAIAYQPIESLADLPRGWTASQGPGTYRLQRRSDDQVFAYGPAYESLKRYLHPPTDLLWQARRGHGALDFVPAAPAVQKVAFVGVRPCELEAVARLDTVLLHGPHVDPAYQARRAAMLFIAVNCVEPGDTCFCASMHTGPRAGAPFDLAVTELAGDRFVAEVGSTVGADLLSDIEGVEAPPALAAEADEALRAAAARMGRDVQTAGLAADLVRAIEHPEWDAVAKRCLSCANCTMVCPTCFCHTVEDRTDLSGGLVERRRRWDTCFTSEFSYIHGGSIRPSVRARYRQWLMHKFSYWVEQFGTYGCVGCGRCITWCPAGIDITEELERLRA